MADATSLTPPSPGLSATLLSKRLCILCDNKMMTFMKEKIGGGGGVHKAFGPVYTS